MPRKYIVYQCVSFAGPTAQEARLQQEPHKKIVNKNMKKDKKN